MLAGRARPQPKLPREAKPLPKVYKRLWSGEASEQGSLEAFLEEVTKQECAGRAGARTAQRTLGLASTIRGPGAEGPSREPGALGNHKPVQSDVKIPSPPPQKNSF